MSDPSEQVLKIYSLTCEQLVEYLTENNFSPEVCQTFTDQDFDGDGFMELSEEDFKGLFPNKMGTVKKLIRIQRTGSAVAQPKTPSTTGIKDAKMSSSNDEPPSIASPPTVAPRPKPRTIKSSTSVLPTTQDASSSSNSHILYSTMPNEGNVQKKATILQKDIDMAIQKQHTPFSYIMPQTTDTVPLTVRFSNPDDVDVSTLNCDELVEWLSAKGFSSEDCQAFRINKVTGSTFLELEKDDLIHIVKQIGIVKELQKIQQQINSKSKETNEVSDPLRSPPPNMQRSTLGYRKNTTDTQRQYERLAVRTKEQSTKIKNSSSKITTYKLPIKQIMCNDKKGVAKSVLGTPMPGCQMSERVLMVVGATGAGKTTLINGMVNYIFGVEWEDDFRLMLVTENTAKSQAHSQTNLITAYTIYPTHGSNLRFPLTIIDTPGFGDTRGLERDKMIIQQIQDFFSIKDANGIDHLDGIGFVAQASLARLTPIQNYVFHSILSVFGSDVANNLFIMVTFADGQVPPVMAAIEEAKIECTKYYKFNNSALFANNKQVIGEEDENFDKMFWRMGVASFKKFFNEFSKADGVSLYLTKEVLRERRQLELTVQSLQQQISAGVAKLEELRQEEIILQQREAEIATNKDFKYTVEVTKQRKVDLPTGRYVTNCLTCNFTCHESCAYPDNTDKYKCSAMDSGGIEDAKCRICPEKCFWQNHVNNPYRFELYKENEERTSEELQEKYKTAMQGKNKVESILNQINYYLVTVEDDVISKVDEVQRALQRLDKIALKQSPLTQVQHLDLLIEAEKQEGKPGYQSRIKIYEQAKGNAQLLEKAKNNPESLRILKEQRKKKIEEAKKQSHGQPKSWFNPLKYW